MSHGAKAIALTEHGSLRSCYELHQACKSNNVKPIYGVEFYLSKDLTKHGLTDQERKELTAGLKPAERKEAIYQEEKRLGLNDRHHLTVLAMDDIGLANLFRLTTIGWLHGFHRRPRIDLDTLFRHNSGLIVLTGCSSGLVSKALAEGKETEAREIASRMRDVFGDRLYVEVMPHGSSAVPATAGPLVRLAQDLGISFVATQDAHYPCSDDWEFQEAMLSIRTHDVLLNPKRFRFDTHDFFLRSYDQMVDAFRAQGHISEESSRLALDRTREVAERCTAKLPLTNRPILPAPKLPAGVTEGEYLRLLCEHGVQWRQLEARASSLSARTGVSFEVAKASYTERLEREIRVIEERGFQRYFFMVHEMYNWARKRKIWTAPGRGSVGGSLVAYLLGITSVDPIRHGLSFDRFLSPARVDSWPDIDADFADIHRDLVFDFFKDRYGADRVSRIGTVGRLKGRGALRNIARALLVSSQDVERVVDLIEEPIGDDRPESTYCEAVEKALGPERDNPEFETLRAFNETYPYIAKLARRLEGEPKTLGLHAGGIVVSDRPLIDIVPLEVRKQKNSSGPGTIATAFPMDAVAAFGLVKLDLLGVKNITVLYRCKEWIEERYSKKIDLDEIDLDDPHTLKVFSMGQFSGLFQFDTPAMRRLCQGVMFRSFEDIAAMTALVRPGTSRSDLGRKYLERRSSGVTPTVHPTYDEICKETYGVPVYQEQLTAIFELAGYTPAEADKIRKVSAKKHGAAEILAERDRFVSGCVANGIDAKVADELLTGLVSFAYYSFNKAHATSYSLVTFWQAWMKLRAPAEFFAAVLASDAEAIKDPFFTHELATFGVQVGNVSIVDSKAHWSPGTGRTLAAPLMSLKGLGEKAAAAIIAHRPFTSFVDFCRRIPRKACNLRVVKSLFTIGAFSGLRLDDTGRQNVTSLEQVVNVWEQTRPAASPAKAGVGSWSEAAINNEGPMISELDGPEMDFEL
jgi:DNA polymerase-3 subunit alpha